MKPIFGLDFGTTNSTLSINKDGEVTMLAIDPTSASSETLRSVLYFSSDKKQFVGQEAITHYLDDAATGRFMQSIKNFLSSTRFAGTLIDGHTYSIEELVALLLRAIKERGEAIVGEAVDRVIIGRPVVFSDDVSADQIAQDRLRTAAESAGFREVIFQFEPLAAAFTYEKSLKFGEEKKVLIGDFGGGTSDFTVINVKNEGDISRDRNADILALTGVPVGGDLFNSRIMARRLMPYYGSKEKYRGMRDQEIDVPASIFRQLNKWHLIPQLREKKQREDIKHIRMACDNPKPFERLEDLIDNNYGFKLFQAIELAKCELSLQERTTLNFSELKSEIHEIITRKEFEMMIAEDLNRITESVDDALRISKLSPDDIDVVFITGGSSYVPSIRQIFIEKFGEKKLLLGEAFTSVGYGLGIAGSFMEK